MSFNRTVVPSEGGNFGQLFAEFLRIDEDSELSLTEMQKLLYDRLYRLGMVRHLDGRRATRRRSRDRNASKRRRSNKVERVEKVVKTTSKPRSKAAKPSKGKGSSCKGRCNRLLAW